MDFTESRRLDLKTLLVSVLCLSGAGAGGYFLYADFNQAGSAGHGKPMAKVERHEAKVRRKAASSFVWSNVQQDETLYRKDSVQTSAGSAAAIRFNDGALLELGENSLVIIDDIQNLSLNFMRGSFVVRTSKGDAKISVGSDGKAKIEELPIRLIRPEPLARYFSPSESPKTVQFSWKPRAGQSQPLPSSYEIEVSPDRGFRSSRTQTIRVEGTDTWEASAQLRPGQYYWRVAAGDKPLTEVSQFRIVPGLALKPVWPVQGEKLLSYGDVGAVQFRWVSPKEGTDEGVLSDGEHVLQISRDQDFKSVQYSQEVEPSSGLATLKAMPEGDWFWRIRSRYGDLAVDSGGERFAIGRLQRPAVTQTLPDDKATFEKLPQLRFGWTCDTSDLSFQIDVQDSKGASVLSQKSNGTSFVWKKPDPGVYRWKVAALYKGQVVSDSGWRGFSVFEGAPIALRQPAKNQEIRFWEKPAKFNFSWDKDPLGESQGYQYRLDVARDAELKSVVFTQRTQELSLPSEAARLGGGTFFWRVSLVDAAGQTVKSSEVSRFVYGVYPPLRPPEHAAPEAGIVYNVVEHEQTPVAQWSEVKDAEQYEVTLYQSAAGEPDRSTASAGASGGSKVVFQELTSKTSAEFKSLQPGKYFWTVRAIDPIKRKGEPLPPKSFVITYGDQLASPEITSPEVQ